MFRFIQWICLLLFLFYFFFYKIKTILPACILNLIPPCAKNLPKRSWISTTLKFTDTGTWTCWFRRSIYWSIPKQNYQSRKGTWNRYIQRVLQREECSWFDYSKWRKSFNNSALAQKPVMKCKILLISVFKLFWIVLNFSMVHFTTEEWFHLFGIRSNSLIWII